MSLDKAWQSLDEFYLYYKDPKFTINNPQVSPHMYIMLPCSDNECIIITLITSSQKYKKIYDEKCLDCVIELKNNELDFINKECIIDCNMAELKEKAELIDNGARAYKCETIPQNLLDEIKQKIKHSPLVKKKTKKFLL